MTEINLDGSKDRVLSGGSDEKNYPACFIVLDFMPVYQFTAFGYLSFNVRVFDTCFKRYTLNFFVSDDHFFDPNNNSTKIYLVVKNNYLELNISDPTTMNKGKTE